MLANFERFVKERQYLQNVSPATVEWYRESFKWLASERPTAEELKGAVLAMRTKGRNAAGCNSTIRAINAYLKWAGSSQRIAYLKEPQFVLPVFRPEQISKLVRWKADGFYKRRLHLTVLILFDTGARIDEVLSLHVSDRDLDSLLFTLTGKGRKQRRVPFSFELRRVLARYTAHTKESCY